jgi:hypothetical protein
MPMARQNEITPTSVHMNADRWLVSNHQIPIPTAQKNTIPTWSFPFYNASWRPIHSAYSLHHRLSALFINLASWNPQWLISKTAYEANEYSYEGIRGLGSNGT